MCNLFCNIAAKQVGMQSCAFYHPQIKLVLQQNQVVVNLILLKDCKTGLNMLKESFLPLSLLKGRFGKICDYILVLT